MAVQAEARTTPRVRLSRDLVLRAAIQIADKSGIEALTMRNLAQQLGVEAMTVYYYVAKKHDKKSNRSDGEFGFGLDLILDGLEKIRTNRPASRARTDTPRAKRRRRPNC